jgi:SAM-dependent methyltransferase
MNPLGKSLHRRELEKHLKYLLPGLSGAILDVGSKNRRYDYLLSSRPIAIDIVPNKEKDVLDGDIQNLQFQDNSFNSVVCLEVLEYVRFPQKAIDEMYRVLQAEGNVVVSLPFMMRSHEDRARYTKERLLEFFKNFSEVTIIPIGNFYTIILDVLRGKIMEQGFIFKIILGILWLPLTIFLPLAKLSKDTRYVSGHIVIAKK